MPEPPDRWFIEEWSRERARGTVRSLTNTRLPFDAAAATVSDFFLGEEVRIRTSAAPRVLLVEPVHTGEAVPQRLEAEVSITPTGYLAVRRADLDADAADSLEDLAFERCGIISLTDGPFEFGMPDPRRRGFIVDRPDLRPLVATALGRSVDELVRINATYPFDWQRSNTNNLDALFDQQLAPRLPGFTPRGPFFAPHDTPFDADTAPIPSLSWSIETVGLLVSGVLPRTDWTRWRAAFEQLTAQIPMRTW